MNHIIPQTRLVAFLRAREETAREVRGRYEAEWQQAGPWKRVGLWFKIQRTIAAELKRRFPPHALYARRPLA